MPGFRWLSRLVLGAAFTLLACGGGETTGAGGTAAPVESVTLAPDFTLRDLSGQPVNLGDFRGKTVVIDFWATWCPPCEFQVPELNKLWTAHKDAGDLMVIGVSVDTDGVEVVRPWVEQHGVEYTIVMGDEVLAREFGAMGFPTLVVVTPDGAIDSLHVGLIEVSELEEIVAQVPPARST